MRLLSDNFVSATEREKDAQKLKVGGWGWGLIQGGGREGGRVGGWEIGGDRGRVWV